MMEVNEYYSTLFVDVKDLTPVENATSASFATTASYAMNGGGTAGISIQDVWMYSGL